jgi:hypothetical protein
MRKIFTDKINSFFHFLFGTLSYNFFIIIPIFLLYQSIESMYLYNLGIKDYNLLIDISEFFIGYLSGAILYRIVL